MELFPPPARASKNIFGVIRESLLKRLTMIDAMIATAAENAIVFRPLETIYTSRMSGISRYIFRISFPNFGSWSRLMPFKPSLCASRCTQMKMPRK